ncbi:MAG: L,D-transpeptidase [Symploca sp. SIO3C6]|nr:L,D-transpeptidase [Symploca sp. SIO3C6]
MQALKKAPRNFLVIFFSLITSSYLYFQLNRLGYIPALFQLLDIVCLHNCIAQSNLHKPLAGKQLLNYNQKITEIIGLSTIEKTQISILIEKSKYRLTVYHAQEPIKSYPVVFGKNPVNDKVKEGDLSTPEGIFKIRDLYPHSAWSKFLWIDYPTPDSWRKHFQAKREGKIGKLERIGSEIGIHGVPTGADALVDQRSNWTWGCISLKNQDIDELYQIVQQGTQVEIIP